MKRKMVQKGLLVALLIASFTMHSKAAAKTSDSLPGLKNPSIRVLVDETNAVPACGTVGWGMSLFRVARNPATNLSSVDERLHQALKAGFASKGFTYAKELPDYIVSYALASGAEIYEAELNQAYGDILQMPAAGTNEVESTYYKRGVLIVDFVERKSKRLLWRGAIFAEIDITWPEERKQERCNAAIGALMRFFPHPLR